MEFLTALILLLVFGAIFGGKKGKRTRRTKGSSTRAKSPKPTARPKRALAKRAKGSPPSETELLLKQAIQTGEVLTVAYEGGTQPGTTRQIHPLKLHNDKVRAYCYSSKAEKDFFIAKIKPQPPGTETSYEDLAGDGSLDSVEAFKSAYLYRFKARGWTIDHTDDYVKLFDHFKNKKPRKTPALTLSYEPTYSEIDWLSEDDKTITHQRLKPWTVSTRNGSSQFSSLQRALAKFIILERQLSPTPE